MFRKKRKAMEFEVKQKKSKASDFETEAGKPGVSLFSKVRRSFIFNFLITLLKSLNPDAYARLSSKRLSQSFTYLFQLILIMLLISFILMIPKFGSIQKTAADKLSEFSSFKLDAKTKDTLPIISNPFSAVLDTTLNASKGLNYSQPPFTEYDVIISDEGIFRKPFACMLWEPLCYLYSPEERMIRKGGSDFSDVLKYKDDYARIIGVITLMFLPYIFIILFVFFSIKYILLVLLFSSLMFLASKGLKHKLGFRKILNIALHAVSVMIVLQILSFSLGFLTGILIYLPLALFLLFFIIGVIILQEEY